MDATEPLAEQPAPIAPPNRGLRGWYEALDRRARIIVWVSAVGLLWRMVFVGFIHRPWLMDYSDMHSYLSAAEHYADLGRSTDTGDWYYPSGTGASIGLWLLLFGVEAGKRVAGELQAVMAAAVVPLTYVIGRRFFTDARVAFWAAILYAVHYLPMGFAGLFMSETYLTIGLAGAMALLQPERPRSALAAGLALGYGAWAKSQAFLLAPLWAALLLLDRKVKPAVAVLVGVLCFVVPVSVIATIKSGQPSFISSNGGQTFALGQCPVRTMIFEHPQEHWRILWSAPDLNQRTPRGEVEASWQDAVFDVPFNHSRYYMGVGLDCIRRYPRHALRTLFFHVADTFSGPPWSNIIPWPESHAGYEVPAAIANWFVSYLLAPLAFFALALHRRERGIWIVFGFPVLSLLASAVLFHGDPRFRVPYDFTFFLAGAQGYFTLRAAWLSRAGRRPAPQSA
jgi:hypothetical protein